MTKALLFVAVVLLSVKSFGDMPNLGGQYRCWNSGTLVGVLGLKPDEAANSFKIDSSRMSPAIKFATSDIACVNSSPDGTDLDDSYGIYACDETRISNHSVTGSVSRTICVKNVGVKRITVHSLYSNAWGFGLTDYKFDLDCEKIQTP